MTKNGQITEFLSTITFLLMSLKSSHHSVPLKEKLTLLLSEQTSTIPKKSSVNSVMMSLKDIILMRLKSGVKLPLMPQAMFLSDFPLLKIVTQETRSNIFMSILPSLAIFFHLADPQADSLKLLSLDRISFTLDRINPSVSLVISTIKPLLFTTTLLCTAILLQL